MRRSNAPKSLSSVIGEIVSSYGPHGKLQHGRILAAWEDIVGERIGEQVEKAWVKEGKLFVRIKSPVWRQEMHLNRTSWCKRLNEELGADEVKEIIFR